MIKNLENARKGKLFNLLEGEEDISRRELNVKHFNLGEGRHQAVLYDAPVHYRNENGESRRGYCEWPQGISQCLQSDEG